MRLLPRLAAYRGRRYLALSRLWAAGQLLLFATGLILQQVFNDATAGHPAYSTALSLLAVLAVARILLAAIYWGAMVYWPAWFDAVGGWIRANLLASILVAPGPRSGRMPATTGEGVSRFRDDVEDLGRRGRPDHGQLQVEQQHLLPAGGSGLDQAGARRVTIDVGLRIRRFPQSLRQSLSTASAGSRCPRSVPWKLSPTCWRRPSP